MPYHVLQPRLKTSGWGKSQSHHVFSLITNLSFRWCSAREFPLIQCRLLSFKSNCLSWVLSLAFLSKEFDRDHLHNHHLSRLSRTTTCLESFPIVEHQFVFLWGNIFLFFIKRMPIPNRNCLEWSKQGLGKVPFLLITSPPWSFHEFPSTSLISSYQPRTLLFFSYPAEFSLSWSILSFYHMTSFSNLSIAQNGE